MQLRIHAICIALNEEDFIAEAIKPLYQVCSGISVITQYDRDYYNKEVIPDKTVERVLNFPDPGGKIHLIVRRYNDETASRNHEMLSILANPTRKIIPHGNDIEIIKQFHQSPDYFLIVDADEIYDIDTIENIVDYLKFKRPRGMRVSAYQYLHKWNNRIPIDIIHHHHFGFVKAGILFEQRRMITWNEYRVRKILNMLRIPDFSSKLFGFVSCPQEIGMFHHGSYLGDEMRLYEKFSKHSHQEVNNENYVGKIKDLPFNYIDTSLLPKNIKNGDWPANFIDI